MVELDPITTGILIALGGDIVLRTWSTLKRRVSISSPMSDRLDDLSKDISDVGESVSALCRIQREAASDTRVIFAAIEALLINAQLTTKSLRKEFGSKEEFNGDLEKGTEKIDEVFDKYRKHLRDKVGQEADQHEYSCEEKSIVI
jgi:hypothetical protein